VAEELQQDQVNLEDAVLVQLLLEVLFQVELELLGKAMQEAQVHRGTLDQVVEEAVLDQ
jgi:hypothetical protein